MRASTPARAGRLWGRVRALYEAHVRARRGRERPPPRIQTNARFLLQNLVSLSDLKQAAEPRHTQHIARIKEIWPWIHLDRAENSACRETTSRHPRTQCLYRRAASPVRGLRPHTLEGLEAVLLTRAVCGPGSRCWTRCCSCSWTTLCCAACSTVGAHAHAHAHAHAQCILSCQPQRVRIQSSANPGAKRHTFSCQGLQLNSQLLRL